MYKFLKIIFSCFIVYLSCAGSHQFQAPEPVPDDRQTIQVPQSNKINAYGEYFEKEVTEQVGHVFDFSRQLRNLTGCPKKAMNVDALGEVANSAWFTNRNGHTPMSLAAIKQGPNQGEGPDTSGVWTVTRAKAEGVTPGFSIRDARGENYLIKFDPPGYSELVSGAEVISTRLFYAAGYHTPENYITYFHPRILKLGEKVKFTDEKGRNRFMRQDDLEEILTKIQHEPNGYIRALASKYLQGKIIGPFRYKGTRKDDPNDIIPHEHRRELRGLRILAAWLNHFDTKDMNSLDVYVTENGHSFVKHYLIDFGATLGSASWGPNHRWRGHQNDIDPVEMGKNIATLGLYVRPWEKLPGVKYPSVGMYDAQTFKPYKYKAQVPNPAFELMTDADGYWAAKIVMSFTDEQLAIAVAEGQLSNPEAAAYLLQTIIGRRDKVGREYFARVAPLDHFKVTENSQLTFIDLAVVSGLEAAETSEYRYSIRCEDIEIIKDRSLGQVNLFPLPDLPLLKQYSEVIPPESDVLQWEFKLQVRRGTSGKWSRWVNVFLQSDENGGNWKLLGVEREG